MRDEIKQKLAISLETESGVNNEYYTKEEMVAFKKPRKMKKVKKEKKRSRKPVRSGSVSWELSLIISARARSCSRSRMWSDPAVITAQGRPA